MPYSKDNANMFAAYSKRFEPVKTITEAVETDAAVIAKTEDPAHDGAQVTAADKKAANYIANKRKTIEDSIALKKKESEEEEKQAQSGMHSDALYIWDYLLHQKKYAPSEAMNVINLAKAAFEHML